MLRASDNKFALGKEDTRVRWEVSSEGIEREGGHQLYSVFARYVLEIIILSNVYD